MLFCFYLTSADIYLVNFFQDETLDLALAGILLTKRPKLLLTAPSKVGTSPLAARFFPVQGFNPCVLALA